MEQVSSFEVAEINFKVALTPSATAEPLVHIKKQLNSMLLRYNEDINGILFTYGDIEFEKGKESMRIIGEFPWLHASVVSKCLVFKPNPGALVSGTIVKVSELLIYVSSKYF